MADLKKEIENRRTFAIISHPDAGKTTLTEKFLLYGGAIAMAGAVKGNGAFLRERKNFFRDLTGFCVHGIIKGREAAGEKRG